MSPQSEGSRPGNGSAPGKSFQERSCFPHEARANAWVYTISRVRASFFGSCERFSRETSHPKAGETPALLEAGETLALLDGGETLALLDRS